MTNPLDALLAQPNSKPSPSYYAWGVVTATNPFTVLLDRETTPVFPIKLVDAGIGDRVFVMVEDNLRATAIGKPPPPAGPTLPPPLTGLLVTSSQTVTTSTWTSVGATFNLVSPAALLCQVSYHGLPLATASGTTIRARLAWSGATTGDSYALMGNNWAGCLTGASNVARDDASCSFPLQVASGTTTFGLQIMREGGTATPNIADCGLMVTPLRFV